MGNSAQSHYYAKRSFHGATYEDLFVTNNLNTNSHFDNDLAGYTIISGTPVASTDDCYTPGKSLKCFGSSSNHVGWSSAVQAGDKLYVAAKIKVIRYVSGGGLGFITSWGDMSASIQYKTVTENFITSSFVYTASSSTFSLTIGSMESANMDGYIDDIVVVNINNISQYNPTTKDLDRLYDDYLGIRKGINAAVHLSRYRLCADDDRYIASQAAKANFIREMNKKALSIGMAGTYYAAPHSANSTAQDLIRLGIHAYGYADIQKAWNKKSYVFYTKGANPRKITINTTVTSSLLEDNYYIFGGKTGTSSATQQSLIVMVNAPNDRWFIITIAENATDRFQAAKELADIATECVNNSSFTPPGEMTCSATNFAVGLVPLHSPFSYDGCDIPLLYSANETIVKACASTAKVMTCTIMLDYVKNLNERIEITADDDVETPFQAGDIITYKDALYAMLLPSSNTAAKAVARSVASKIINNQ